MLSVARIADRRALSGVLVTSLCCLAALTLGGSVPDAAAAPSACGTPGADGPQPTLGGIVNSYFPGTSASVAVGATSLTVGASTGSSTPIAVGDKLLIIQIQSATIDSSNTDAYGDGSAGEPPSGAASWASAGVYEFAVAANNLSGAGGTLQLATGTVNAYASAAATASAGQQAFQVVRVPQYSSATLGSDVTATPWDGATGGIVALDVAGALDLNGFRVDVSARGFRGGAGRQLSGGAGGANTDVRTSAASAYNGGKAEGVAGTPRYVFDGTTTVDTGVEGYPDGSFARGAPANAGGGGTDGNPSANDQNSGGGGGANAGAGGQGGNTWSSNLAVGGAGGVAVPALGATKVVLGGGGGGATRNNAGPSSGGVGAGLVILDVGSLTGTGEIRANGGDGQTAANDGGGGGGAGGTVVVAAAGGGLSGLTVSANGGDGGDAWPTEAPGGLPGARHGPGGGGGGGFVLLSTSGATTTTDGGAHGITTTANDAYGATDGIGGSAGTFAGSLPGSGSAASCSPPAGSVPSEPGPASADLSLTKTTSQSAVATGEQISYALTVHNAGPNPAAAVSVTDSLPAELVLVSATGDGWTCSSAGASITCTRAQLAVGATSTVTVVVGASRGGTITNSATVTAGTADPVTSNNVGSATVRIGRLVDLAVSKTVSAPTFVAGKRIAFTIVVRNNGPDDVEGVVVRDLVPAALADFGWTCSAVLAACGDLSGVGSVVQEVSIRVGGRVVYRLAGVVPRGSPPTITNRVTVAPPVDVIDTDPSNNAATARVRVGIGPTTLRVTVTPRVATVASGEPKQFMIRTSNTGNAVARGVVTCVTIPQGASIAGATGGFVVTSRYCWRASSLAAGKTVQYAIRIVGDRRQARVVVLGVRAEARNAPGARATARVDVLPAVSSTSGGFTG